ncbi:MAG: ATP-dependent DNA helicase RecG [Zetaproteobacteria bacterium]|nr:ATP-dependent DNA helicase RecG [Zetaproteobacteria bacterium]
MYAVLTQPISILEGVGPALAKRLQQRQVITLGDLLLHLPKSYHDDRQSLSIAQLQTGVSARVHGKVLNKQQRGFGQKQSLHLQLVDDAGDLLTLTFFNAAYMMRDQRLTEGRKITVRGVPEHWQGRWQMSHPEWQVIERFQAGFSPVYGSLAGMSGLRISGFIAKAMQQLQGCSPLDSVLDRTLLQALTTIHTPEHDLDMSMIARAHQRLKVEEWLVYLHALQLQRADIVQPASIYHNGAIVQQLLQQLPFQLTAAQAAVWQDITKDLAKGERMHRLLQGDVGAGKTVIAALAAAMVIADGAQAALMAPTEVLATQHHVTLQGLFAPLGIEVALLTGSTGIKARRQLLENLADGRLSLLIGTHALLTEDVRFHHLALAMVDEQHRFGVQQRWFLTEKGASVHLLAMTATPIPRSLAMAIYGDMDLSLMQGLPPGRKPIETRVLAQEKFPELLAGMQRLLAQDGRIYWIVPRIDDDEAGISVGQRAELLQQQLPEERVLALHGRMKPKEKHQVLSDFASGQARVLVSTTVVEVGVNVPEARLIVIEQAEQYGLAQLHQLRGRVGRSSEQGYCLLVAGSELSTTAMQRLQKMRDCHDGLELAEMDLQLRGAGDAIGVRQSGEAGFRLLDPALDGALIRSYDLATLNRLSPKQKMELTAISTFWRPTMMHE